MNLLRRTDKRPDGIFGEFTFDDEGRFCFTLEHAYQQPHGGYEAKVPPGVYKCIRGMHWLHNGPPFETFEITGVTGHSGILFHAGNFNKDSEGCVLVGKTIAINPANGEEMVTGSRDEFEAFMERLDDVNSFLLEIV